MNDRQNDHSKILYSHFESLPSQQTISEPRVSYLRSVFGITGEYCHAFLFDGYNFCLETKVSYRDILSIDSDEAQFEIVDANEYWLPMAVCQKHYEYTCIDGTPDLRYSNNPAYVYTYKFLLSLTTSNTTYNMFTFALSEHIVNNALAKFRNLLWVKDKVDIELPFESYLQEYRQKEDLEKSKLNIVERKENIEKVIKSFNALPQRERSNSDLRTKCSEAVTELAAINKQLEAMSSDIEQSKRLLLEVPTQLKKSIEIRKNLDTIKSF